MKKSLVAAFLMASLVCAQADEQVRLTQSALKQAGFYFGKEDGNMGEETRAALRRFQIRNGLDVTGTATPETLSALKLGRIEPTAPRTAQNSAAAAEDEQQIAQTARAPEPKYEQTRPPEPPTVVLQPERPPIEAQGRSPVSDFFIDTDLEDADSQVQSAALRKAQIQLASLGYYRAAPNGLPGPEMETGLLKFQHASRLRLTGRLDDDTRRALVDAPPGVPSKPFRSSKNRPSGSTLRGIWIQ